MFSSLLFALSVAEHIATVIEEAFFTQGSIQQFQCHGCGTQSWATYHLCSVKQHFMLEHFCFSAEAQKKPGACWEYSGLNVSDQC